jgi:hypothetical protein
VSGTPATITNLVAKNAELTKRVESLETALLTIYLALKSLELGLRGFKPLPLARPEHAALRAIVIADPIDTTALPYVLPRTVTHGMRPRETRPAGNTIEVADD